MCNRGISSVDVANRVALPGRVKDPERQWLGTALDMQWLPLVSTCTMRPYCVYFPVIQSGCGID